MCICDLFTCPNHTGELRLTTSACAANWRRAKNAQPWDSLRVCWGCPIGAANAGEAPTPAAPTDRACLRCGATGRRLVRKQICVSCFNREREVVTGRYRRLVPPAGLRITELQVQLVGSLAPLPVRVASLTEALLVAARRHPGAAILAAAAACPPWNALCRTTLPQRCFLPGF